MISDPDNVRDKSYPALSAQVNHTIEELLYQMEIPGGRPVQQES